MSYNTEMKISLVTSVMLHLLAFSMLFLIPQKGIKKENPLMARLVTPEEITLPEVRKGEGRDKIPQRMRPIKSLKDKEQRSSGSRAKGPGQPGKREVRGEKPEVPTSIISSTSVNGGSVEGGSRGQGVEGSSPPTQPFVPSTPQPSAKTSPLLPKERFFDREVVERLAKKEKEEVKPDKGITFDTKELKYYSYMQRLKERIEGIWRYPPDAAEKGIYGDLYIRFTIRKDGKLGNIELLRTSGYRNLDEAAMRALRDAEPFWPLPDEWKKDDLIITGHFIYSLYGVYLR